MISIKLIKSIFLIKFKVVLIWLSFSSFEKPQRSDDRVARLRRL